MTARFLLDTRILIWWLTEPDRLSREQARVLRRAVDSSEPLAFSAFSFVEMALLSGQGRLKSQSHLSHFLDQLEESPAFQVLPITYDVAREVVLLGPLRDPADRTIVATARVHGLRLVTADQRIIESNLVSVVE